MTATDIGLLLVRLAIGASFAAHGAQKVLGWWEGPGFTRWTAAITRMGLRPAWLWAGIAAGVELVCGPLLALGLLTPVAAALVVAQSSYIVVKAHLSRGWFNGKGGIEFPLQLLAGSLLIVLTGPGALSLDSGFGIDLGTSGRIVLLVVAMVGAIAGMIIARPQPQPPTPPRTA